MSGNNQGQAGRTPLSVVQIRAVPAGLDPADVATAEIRMSIGGYPVRLDLAVPGVPTRLQDLLPIFQGMANVEVDVAVQTVEQQGLTISCCKGCGACCRQPVPITETEARALVQLVDRIPEPRRSHVRARFVDAHQRLEAAGMLNRIRRWDEVSGPNATEFAVEYFHLGIPCPFLEEESCSIHLDRPLACREFLVTSPAEHCAHPEKEKVQRVPLRGEIFRAARGVDGRLSNSAGFTLMVLAPEWVAEHADEPPPKPGPAWLQDFFSQLAHRGDREVEFVPVAGWVIAGNLLPFLTAVGWVVGYGFGPGDWETVSAAMPQTDATADRWHNYAFAGGHRAKVRLARDPDGGTVQVRLEVPKEVEAQVKLAIGIFQRFHVQ
jgi:Fe-S-cluster containining protein